MDAMKGSHSPVLINDHSRATTAYPKSAGSRNGLVPPPTPRNMTGIYLGLENGEPPRRRTATVPSPSGVNKSAVPPLARGRGVPMRIRTPTEQKRYFEAQYRLKLVEDLRSQKEDTLKSKEERRTGLIGNPVKAHQRRSKVTSNQVVDDISPRLLGSLPSQTDIKELTRRNPREYSFVNNQGVTHPEYLRADLPPEPLDPVKAPNVFSLSLQETVAQEVDRVSKSHDLIGLEECYKKVCRGKIGSLHSLLPQRKLQQARKDNQQRNTGFSIKSYRNPNRAEILAQFPSDDPRPKTTLGRALVPQPYFFKMYVNHPQRANSSPARSKKTPFEEQFSSLQGSSKIIAAPGAGSLSQSLIRNQRVNTPCDPEAKEIAEQLADQLKKDMYIQPGQEAKSPDNAETVAVPQPDIVDDNRSEITTVTENGGGDQQVSKESMNDNNNVSEMKPLETNNNMDAQTTEEVTENTKNDNDSINLVLQNEDGSRDVVDIDENDEVIATSPVNGDEEAGEKAAAAKEKPVLQRRTSIQERLMRMKSSESLVESIKSECETRRKDFEDLIEEHAQIIEEISTIKESASVENDLNDLVNGGSQT